jgi:NAD(P)-dependent dehydrogenase (short-subunit alcohol dehydrogenase family)
MNAQKHAVVIGGGRGIGEAIVRRLANDGYIVTIADRLAEEASALAAKLNAEGKQAFAQGVDITSETQIAALADAVKKRAGNSNVMAAVNTVGLFNARENLINTSLETYRRVMEVNLTGAFIFSKAIVPLMGPNASLVHIGSVNGVLAGSELGAYKIAKCGLQMLTRCLALDLAADPRRIRVNNVGPGWVDTPGERSVHKPETGKPHPLDDPEALKYIPLGRRTLAREIADTVGFLCSEGGSAITGQTIYVDCGITAASRA